MTSLTLSSDPAITQNSRNSAQDFTVKLSRPIMLDSNKKYEIALLRCNMSYSWHNIEQLRSNNIVRYRTSNVASWNTITFVDGIYSYTDIITYIKDKMVLNGDVATNINLDFSLTTFLVTIEILNGYEFDLYTQEFSNLLGFNVGILTTTTTSNFFPNITNSLETLYIHCSIVVDSIVDGTFGDVVYALSTANLTRSYPFREEPYNLVWNRVNSNIIQEIRMYVTDVNNRIIDLNSIPTSYTLSIREIKI